MFKNKTKWYKSKITNRSKFKTKANIKIRNKFHYVFNGIKTVHYICKYYFKKIKMMLHEWTKFLYLSMTKIMVYSLLNYKVNFHTKALLPMWLTCAVVWEFMKRFANKNTHRMMKSDTKLCTTHRAHFMSLLLMLVILTAIFLRDKK